MSIDPNVSGNPPPLNDGEMDEAIELAHMINDLLYGVGTHQAVWALGFSIAAGALYEVKANPDLARAGLQFCADAATVAVKELNQLLEDDENGTDDTTETRH